MSPIPLSLPEARLARLRYLHDQLRKDDAELRASLGRVPDPEILLRRAHLVKELEWNNREIDELEADIPGESNALVIVNAAGRVVHRLQPGSRPWRTVKILRRFGRPIHIDQLNDLLTVETRIPCNKASLLSTLTPFVIMRRLFTRPAPNTFGLVEWGDVKVGVNAILAPFVPDYLQ